MITRNAYAKINLGLEVTGRREDGYHDLVTVLQQIELHDTLTFADAEGIEVETDHPVLGAAGRSNLVYRAASLLRETAGTARGAHIHVEKRIPLSGGLGGGSSDAAATLDGLAELWELDMPASKMGNLAAILGSDVPFFLSGPTALVEGRGEKVTPIVSPPPGWAVLVSPPYDISHKTERLYGALDRQDMSAGIVTRQLVSSIKRGEFPSPSLMFNAFERAAYRVFDGLDDVRQQIVRAGGDDVRLSGSGPTLFVLFPEARESQARNLCGELESQGLRTFLSALRR